MTVITTEFFPPQQRLIALPRRHGARLYLTSRSMRQRWQHSQLYPAFRATAQLYRFALRAKVALGLGETWINQADAWDLGDFVRDCLPSAKTAVVLLGTPGPAQKITVQLWEDEIAVGYVKYAEKPAARARLEQEGRILAALPTGVGPRPLKYGALSDGVGLLMAPVDGNALPARLPPPTNVLEFLHTLRRAELFRLEEHPWVQNLVAAHGRVIDLWLEPLARRSWCLACQHGDLAPWNLVRSGEGRLSAIDWEYGNTSGFPYLDLAYYLLQMAVLMRRWSPGKASAYTIKYLSRDLAPREAEAIVKLTAFDAYHKALIDGHGPAEPLQRWRRAVWEWGPT